MEEAKEAPPAAAAAKTDQNGRIAPAKKGRTLGLLRVALFMVRHRKKGPVPAEIAETGRKGLLKHVLGAVRPLHHQLEHHEQKNQEQKNLEQPSQLEIKPVSAPSPRDLFHEVRSPPMSPAVSEGKSSRYASAEDLRVLDESSDEEDEEGNEPEEQGSGVPNAIDVKAEEFITNFYRQMRIEHASRYQHSGNEG